MRKYLIFLIVLAMLLTFTGCKSRTKTLLDSDCIRITQEGTRIAITDTIDNISYTFILKRKKPIEGDVEPIRVINTKNLIIDKCPKKLLITDLNTNENYTICISILRVKVIFNGNFREKGGD